MAWKGKVRVAFSCMRLRLNPRVKRGVYIRRLESVMVVCDRIASNPDAFEKLQLDALDCMIRAIKACYGIISDVEVEQIEEEIEELKRKEAEHGVLSYRLPEATE